MNLKHICIACQQLFKIFFIDIVNNSVYDYQMDIQNKLKKIIGAGLTQVKIAALISTETDVVSQPVVHRYYTGKNTRMTYDRAVRVDALYKKLVRQKKIKND